MHLTDDESSKFIRKIKPHISGFSRQIHLSGKHLDKVVSGGRVTSILDMSNWSDSEGSDVVYVRIDDVVGDILILVPGVLWREISASIGDIVIANGVLFELSMECTFKSKAGTDIVVKRGTEPFRVLVHSIHKLPKEEGE